MIGFDDVDKLSERAAKDYLKQLILALDDLDDEDFFGTEGWHHFLMREE